MNFSTQANCVLYYTAVRSAPRKIISRFFFVFCFFLRNKNTLIRCDSLYTADFLSIT